MLGMKQCRPLQDQASVVRAASRLCRKMIFDVLCYAHHNSVIEDVSNLFISIMDASDAAALELFDAILEDGGTAIIEILLTCPDHLARGCVCQVLTLGGNRMFDIEAEFIGETEEVAEGRYLPKSRIERLVNLCISQLPVECAKSWTKFEQFFCVSIEPYLVVPSRHNNGREGSVGFDVPEQHDHRTVGLFPGAKEPSLCSEREALLDGQQVRKSKLRASCKNGVLHGSPRLDGLLYW